MALRIHDVLALGHETGPAAGAADLVGRTEDFDERDQLFGLDVNDLQEGFLDLFIHQRPDDERFRDGHRRFRLRLLGGWSLRPFLHAEVGNEGRTPRVVVVGDVDTQLHPGDVTWQEMGIQGGPDFANQLVMDVRPDGG
jgi:hypothetical protein